MLFIPLIFVIGKEASSNPPTTALKIANSSVFTQELSGNVTTQKSTKSQDFKLSNSSVFTQELSGKDPFMSASNVFTKATEVGMC